jgi:predicted Zn-dependent peptidase
MNRFLSRARCFGVALWVTQLIGVAEAGAQERFAILQEPGTPVVAMEVLVATGLADEPQAKAGLAYLAARAVVGPILPVLDSLGARVSVRAQKDALSFSLVAAPDAWEEASRTLLVALFRDPVDSLATDRERRAIRAELLGREPNPADALARETDAAVYGPSHPWGRSEVGYASTIQQISVGDVDRFLRSNMTPGRTVVAVVGPFDRSAAAQHLYPFFQTAEWPARRIARPEPLDSPVEKDYNSITTWISASYRFAPTADVEALRLLADLATEALSFGPTQRTIYDVQSEVRLRAGDGDIRFQVVVPPSETELWAGRIRDAVARFATAKLSETDFEERLRHYRGRRLLELASPEERAREAARRMFMTGASGPLTELEDLTPERLHVAARALQTPILVFLGPSVDANT